MAALRTLRKDERVASCLESQNLPPELLPAEWFIASEIHLSGPSERDLIVLPGDRLSDTPPDEPSPNACLVGANTAQFWVLRETASGVTLILSEIALGLAVLQIRTKGLRDIQLGAVVGGYADTLEYQFNGHSYELARRSSELIGAEIPRDLSGYETSKPLTQLRGQSSELVRAKARAWIWQRWQAHALSYLKVRRADNDGTEVTCTYFITGSETAKWQVTLRVHRVHLGDRSRQVPLHTVEEAELLIADQVQRIEPTTDDSHPLHALSDSVVLRSSEYKLQFVDYAGRVVAIL